MREQCKHQCRTAQQHPAAGSRSRALLLPSSAPNLQNRVLNKIDGRRRVARQDIFPSDHSTPTGGRRVWTGRLFEHRLSDPGCCGSVSGVPGESWRVSHLNGVTCRCAAPWHLLYTLSGLHMHIFNNQTKSTTRMPGTPHDQTGRRPGPAPSRLSRRHAGMPHLEATASL